MTTLSSEEIYKNVEAIISPMVKKAIAADEPYRKGIESAIRFFTICKFVLGSSKQALEYAATHFPPTLQEESKEGYTEFVQTMLGLGSFIDTLDPEGKTVASDASDTILEEFAAIEENKTGA